MSAHPCCRVASAHSSGTADPTTHKVQTDHRLHPRHRSRLTKRIAPGILPAALLILLPKCPICLAAYIALGTGIGLSISTAAHLRIALLILCISSLTFFAASQLRPLLKKISHSPAAD